MEKITTIFMRDEHGVIRPDAYAVSRCDLAGAMPTEKFNGTNVRLTVRSHKLVRVEKRRNPSKSQKSAGIIEPWYIDVDESDPSDIHILAAAQNTPLPDIPDGEWSGEAIGPKIQGNELKLPKPTVVLFSVPETRKAIALPDDTPFDFAGLCDWLPKRGSHLNASVPIEGVVWWHLADVPENAWEDYPFGKIKAVDLDKYQKTHGASV